MNSHLENQSSVDSIKRKAARGLLWSALEIWGRQAGTFVVYVVLARLLQPADFGLVAVARIFLDLALIFIRQGMADAIVQRTEIRPDHLDTVFWSNVGIGLLMMLICVVIAPFVESGMGIEGVALILIAMSPTMLVGAASVVQDGLLRRELQFRPLATRRIAETIAGGLVGIVMAVYGFGAWSLVGQLLVGGLAGAVLLWSSTTWRPGFKVTRQAFGELFGFSSNILASNLVAFASKRADTFLIGRFLGPAALGFYDIATRIMWVLVMALTSVSNRVSFSAFSRINNEPAKVRTGFYELTSWTSLICFPCFAGVAILSPWIVPIVFGSQWTAAVPVMQVITWQGIPQSLSFFNSTILRAMGAPRFSLLVLFLSAIWNIVGFMLVVDNGITAIAQIYVAGGVALIPLGVYWVRRMIGVSWLTYLLNLLPGIGCTLVMVLTMLVGAHYLSLEAPTATNLLAMMLIGFASYLMAALLFARKQLAILWAFRRRTKK